MMLFVILLMLVLTRGCQVLENPPLFCRFKMFFVCFNDLGETSDIIS